MAKFKNLAILCAALMMTATLGAAVGCSHSSSSSGSSSDSPSSSSSSAPEEATEYTVTVTKPDGVTIDGTFTAEAGTDVTFTATVDASYVLSVTGATQVSEPTTADGKTTYTYKVAAIAANTNVTIVKREMQTISACYEKVGETRSKTVVVNTDTEETLNLDAGVYYIAGANEYTTINDYANSMIEVATTGEVTFTLAYKDRENYSYGATDEVTAQYEIYKVNTATATKDYGKATLLSNAYTPFTFSAETAGVYALACNDEDITVAVWSEEDSAYVSVGPNPYYFVATAADPSFNVYVSKTDDNYDNYEFVWDITKVTPTVLSLGLNSHTMQFGDILVTSFTATESGAYCIAAGDYVCVGTFADGKINYPSEYGDYYFDLEADETIYLFLNFDNNDVAEETIAQDFTVSKYGKVGARPATAPEPITLSSVGNSTIPANSETNNLGLVINIGHSDGTWALTWDNASVEVYVNGTKIANGGTTPIAAGSSVVAHNVSDEEVTCYFTLAEYVELAAPLKEGENIYSIDGYLIVDFEVTAGKTYTFTTTHCDVMGVSGGIPDYKEITTYTATTSETIQLAICADLGFNIATIVVKATEATPPVSNAQWTKNY